ncbi:CBO0543 family protein [Paenibacillus filicis]|uniref:CBO0543 family protein n=1 Tax=Paenibacillus filicis TaxID=669464 RepID=A0ABU9DUE9_9BACL
MTIERMVIGVVWIVIVCSLKWLVPKNKRREAALILFADQVFTWSISLILVEIGWNENPVREFVKAGSTNFSFNYGLYPTICVFYCLYYPEQGSWVRKFVHSLVFAGIYTLFIVLVSTYTELIHPLHMRWYFHFTMAFLLFYVVYRYYRWFFRGRMILSAGEHP